MRPAAIDAIDRHCGRLIAPGGNSGAVIICAHVEHKISRGLPGLI
jgi:hypothetical protein